MDDRKSVISSRPRDCFACKIVSGLGLAGIGAYVAKQAFPMKRGYGRIFFFSFSLGSAGLGIARLLDLPPFHTFSHNE